MKYVKLVIAIDDEYQEPFIAELLDLDFDAFEQQDETIITYIPQQLFNDVSREHIEQVLAAYSGDAYIQSEEIIEDQNWNEQWEQTIKAQQIGSFFVKPTWSIEEVPEESILLEIDPKMAFGTGYHETTRLMLKMLPNVIEEGTFIMDAGTGTGILAIASIKLGAEKVFAFDIDEWSITNSKENILLNKVSDKVTVKEGSIEVVDDSAMFDVILANIQRNPLLELIPSFKEYLHQSGTLLMSGLLESDYKIIEDALIQQDLKIAKTRKENEWIALQVVHQ
ncbi:MAG: 50S ribosomal protein L11 methyltransferase [Balneolaceae bacterium]|nr:50S ribosomal protein L11 methyltransferase [Balneolaceae bacterium]